MRSFAVVGTRESLLLEQSTEFAIMKNIASFLQFERKEAVIEDLRVDEDGLFWPKWTVDVVYL